MKIYTNSDSSYKQGLIMLHILFCYLLRSGTLRKITLYWVCNNILFHYVISIWNVTLNNVLKLYSCNVINPCLEYL